MAVDADVQAFLPGCDIKSLAVPFGNCLGDGKTKPRAFTRRGLTKVRRDNTNLIGGKINTVIHGPCSGKPSGFRKAYIEVLRRAASMLQRIVDDICDGLPKHGCRLADKAHDIGFRSQCLGRCRWCSFSKEWRTQLFASYVLLGRIRQAPKVGKLLYT